MSEDMEKTQWRRGFAAGLGVAVAVAAISAATGFISRGSQPPAGNVPDDPASSYVEVIPGPGPTGTSRVGVATAALRDPHPTPRAEATAGIVSPDYEDDVNDMSAGDYQFYVYCVGEGTLGIVIKAGWNGDRKLATGRANCDPTGRPAKL